MSIDDRAFEGLMEESQDLHADSMRHSKALLPDLADAHADGRSDEADPQAVARFDEGRRQHVEDLGLNGGGVAGIGALAGGLGALLAGLLAAPASAKSGGGNRTDISCVQTASSLEILAVATYKKALTLPFIAQGSPVVVKFAQTTMHQHDEHRKAFQGQTKALGGKIQKKPNAKNSAVVQQALPNLKAPLDVVMLAATLETVATNTYLNNLSLVSDSQVAALFGSIQGVECQHLATLRAVGALLQANTPDLIAIPVDASKLPPAAGNVAFPAPFESTAMASDPQEGAIQ